MGPRMISLRHHRAILTSLCAGVLYVVLHISMPQAAQPQYAVTDLGSIRPFSHNNSVGTRAIVGTGSIEGADAAMAIVNGTLVVLEDFGRMSAAYHINGVGEILGAVQSPLPSNSFRPALWDLQGNLMLFPPLAPDIPADASSRNNMGVTAGTGYFPDGQGRGLRWWPDGTVDFLPTLGGATSWGGAIDAQSRVWGAADTAHATTHAVMYQTDGTIVDLGTLESAHTHAFIGAANDQGVGVGVSSASHAAWAATPVKVTLTTGMIALPILSAPFVGCAPWDINNHGQSVGLCYDGDVRVTLRHAVLWRADSTVVDLNTLISPALGWTLIEAASIDEDGSIVGTGLLNGERRGFLLTPITEPPALAVHLNQSSFTPGQTLRMDLELHNPGPQLTTDVYVGVILPDGETVLWLTNLTPLDGVITSLSANPATFAPHLQGVTWPAGLHTTQQDFFTYTFHGLETPGTYHLLVGWTVPNSLQDGSIDDGDVLALAWAPVHFSRGATSDLYATMRAIQARYAAK